MSYITIQDVRDEGYNDPPYSDARITAAIEQAEALIESVTGQWFEPRTRSFRLDVQNDTLEYLFEVPIITIDSGTFWDDSLELDDLWIYNRHLTMGIADDLRDPRIAFKQDWTTKRMRRLYGGRRRFIQSNQRLAIDGTFGYTVLAPGVSPGETAPGSQVPTSYGVTPPEIKRAALLLMQRYLPTIASGDGNDATLLSRVTSVKTQDQTLTLGDAVGSDGSYGVTGILEVDRILSAYMGPMSVGVT